MSDVTSKPMTHRVFLADGGWWARLTFDGYFMERGPYQFKWMARLSFPIIRLTGKWPV